MTLPLRITFIRIFMSPVFLALYLYGRECGISLLTSTCLLLSILFLCELSDIFDGLLARSHNKVTEIGKILDPMADSIFRLSVFLSFTQEPVKIPLFVVLIFFLRDSVITTLRTICALQGITLAARMSGKIKAIVQALVAFLILVAMLFYAQDSISSLFFQKFSYYAASFAALYTLISGVEYLWSHWKLFTNLLKKNLTLPKSDLRG